MIVKQADCMTRSATAANAKTIRVVGQSDLGLETTQSLFNVAFHIFTKYLERIHILTIRLLLPGQKQQVLIEIVVYEELLFVAVHMRRVERRGILR